MNYDKLPSVPVRGFDKDVWQRWESIAAEIRRARLGPRNRAGRRGGGDRMLYRR